ncbi:hypothetical protein M0R45_010287 [Rubus argutus]|uniref:Protein DA1-like domain-containing protein n=1 Tax=Rubus argutus TaxID=59490 RepID=A0AAW1Y6N0_RUBAR
MQESGKSLEHKRLSAGKTKFMAKGSEMLCVLLKDLSSNIGPYPKKWSSPSCSTISDTLHNHHPSTVPSELIRKKTTSTPRTKLLWKACSSIILVQMPNNTLDICDVCHSHSKAGETGYLNLGDGEKLCSDCSSIAVMNGEECNAIIENVFEFYKSLNLKVDESIPIFFIDKNQMLRFFKGKTEKYSRSGGNLKGEKKAMKFLLGDSIAVLFGRPNVDIGRILAHEMMHGWLHLQGCRPWKWERRVEEGVCHVMAYKWMKWFCSSTGFDSWYKTNEQAQYARKLKMYLAQEMETCEDEVYGQGFRDAMCAVERFGFQATLDHTLKHGALPVVPPTVMYCARSSSTTTTTIKSSTSPITALLWRSATSTGESLWRATAATITELLRRATGTFEIPRFIIREGHCHHYYHQGQSHKNRQGGFSASPTLLIVFIGIIIEHK